MAIPNRFGDNDQKDTPDAPDRTSGLVSWIVGQVRRGRDVRDEMYKERWQEYTRLWRGFWSGKDQNTDSERSKIIAPALQQAVEMTVAEMEEAIFSNKAWFDIDDDLQDQQKEDAIAYRDQLLEDFELTGVPSAVSQVLLNGAIYGTGIAKLNVSTKVVPTLDANGEVIEEERIFVTLDPIRPDEFIIDPAARNIEEALYCAHEMLKPIHGIKEKQARGIYRPGHVGAWGTEQRTDPTGLENKNVNRSDEGAMILEYYGKVPARLLPGSEEVGGMVEALVTIANEQTLLKAVPSPFTRKDRPVIAYQHDTVPGEFWGRGVCEKGYNPQKALDAELRARIDALALVTAPMLGGDITRLPRNPDLRVRPGKHVLTRGRPTEVVEPIGFTAPHLAAQFQQTGELERMVQMGTGAMDTATPNNISRRNETMGGMSMLQGGFIKRSKRTMYNIERHFIDKLVQKALWRYMQFDPARYPIDMRFVVNSTMGMMAKEVENAQLIQMLGFVGPESPAHGIVLQALFENAVSSHKSSLHEAIKAMNQPPSPEEVQRQQQLQELALQKELAEVEKEKALAQKAAAEAKLALARAEHERIDAALEDDRLQIAAANAATGAEKARMANRQNQIAAAKVAVDAKKVQVDARKASAKSSS